jgi:hypothetical protein
MPLQIIREALEIEALDCDGFGDEIYQTRRPSGRSGMNVPPTTSAACPSKATARHRRIRRVIRHGTLRHFGHLCRMTQRLIPHRHR